MVSPREIPMLRMLVPFTCGIAASEVCIISIALLWNFTIGLACILFFLSLFKYEYKERWVFGSVLHCFFISAGLLTAVVYNEMQRQDHFSKNQPKEQVFICAKLKDTPTLGAKTKVFVEVMQMGHSKDSLMPCSGNLLLKVDSCKLMSELDFGDVITAVVSILPIEPPNNPNIFDYKRYLHFQNVHYQGIVKDGQAALLAKKQGNCLWQLAYSMRALVLQMLKQHFPSRNEYAVASALMIGYKADLDDEIRSAYVDTGSMHALAVSGSHVAMIYMGLIFLISRIPGYGRGRKWMELCLILGIIWAFALLTGASASVLRATVMFTFYLTGKTIHRTANPFNILAASAFFLLLVNPFFLFDPGFQLSYAAVVGMVYFYPKWLKLSPIFPPIADQLWKLTLVSLSAQVATLPISLYYFHAFPTYFWLSGWIVVPVGGIVLAGGFLLSVFSKWQAAAWVIGKVVYYIVFAMNRLIAGIQHLPYSTHKGIWIDGTSVAVLYLCLFLCCIAFEQKKGKWILGALLLLAVLTGNGSLERLRENRQKTIVVYSLWNSTQIDFIHGRTAINYSSAEISEKAKAFSIMPNRDACGISEVVEINQLDTVRSLPFFSKCKNIEFNGYKMLLLSTTRDPQLMTQNIDALVVSGAENGEGVDILNKITPEIVICTADVRHFTAKKWRSACEQKGVQFYDIRKQGAWIKNL